jgi:uncharacterized protein
MLLIAALSLLIGLLLGLLGGGGSILTLPMLVYLAYVEPKVAIATSLLVVGTTSLVAMIGHARKGCVCWKTGLSFGLAGMIGAYGGGRLAVHVPSDVLLLSFAGLMFATAFALLRGGSAERAAVGAGPICPLHLPLLRISSQGLLVGGLTGLVGAGGGFLIVPALNLLGRLPMRAAVGTSLMVLVMQSFAAFAGHAGHVRLDLGLVGIITAAAVGGSLVGGALSPLVNGAVLRKIFAVCVLTVAGYLVYREGDWTCLADFLTSWLLKLAPLFEAEPPYPWLGLALVGVYGLVVVLATWLGVHPRFLRRHRAA